eukprot:3300308-Rhodomonas_salina.1
MPLCASTGSNKSFSKMNPAQETRPSTLPGQRERSGVHRGHGQAVGEGGRRHSRRLPSTSSSTNHTSAIGGRPRQSTALLRPCQARSDGSSLIESGIRHRLRLCSRVLSATPWTRTRAPDSLLAVHRSGLCFDAPTLSNQPLRPTRAR